MRYRRKMTLFRNRYRIESSRLSFWNYQMPCAYFITICTKNRDLLFGEIIDGRMEATDRSRQCASAWHQLPNHFPHCRTDEFVIMPNHIHGILILTRDSADTDLASVSTIIGAFKSFTSRAIHQRHDLLDRPIWQPRFHDRIIRGVAELTRIRKYIKNNPSNWSQDEHHPSA